MCDRSSMLVFFLILKVIILVITPIVVYFLYKKESKVYNLVGGLDTLFIFLFIILKLAGNNCINNSTFSYIKNFDKKSISVEENNNSYYESILSTNTFTNGNLGEAYYYSINSEPLRSVTLSCDKKRYVKNYGNSISAIVTLVSNYYGVEMNEMDAIKYLEKNNLIDCENGIDFNTAFAKLGDVFYYNYKEIYKDEIDSYLSNGNSVLVETTNKYLEDKNFGCETDYIIIYNKSYDGEYNITNPNDKPYSYFCPSNTIGYGSIIEADQNTQSYSLDDIDSKALRYFVVEVR